MCEDSGACADFLAATASTDLARAPEPAGWDDATREAFAHVLHCFAEYDESLVLDIFVANNCNPVATMDVLATLLQMNCDAQPPSLDDQRSFPSLGTAAA